MSSKDAVEFEVLRDEYLFCRTVGHSWEEVASDDLPKPDYGWRFSLQCTRCLTRRNDIIDPRLGDGIGRNYQYPDHYRLDEKATRSEMRMEWARRRDYDFIKTNRQKEGTK